MSLKIIPRSTGLGDVVAKVAQPVAVAIDAVAGTNLKNCGGCKRRQEKLNQKFPMKNILIILAVCLSAFRFPLSALALDYTYSTNGFYALPTYTNIYLGTNASDGTTNGDSWASAVWKINAAMNLTQRRWDAQMASNALYSASSGGGGLTNIVFTNTATLAAGASATATNVGVVGGIAYFQIGIPQGIQGTNFVTIYGTSNAIETSDQVLVYQTNKIWGASNYLARVNGLYKFPYNPGNDGANPPVNGEYKFFGSYSGSNSWFIITNGFWTSNTITVITTNEVGQSPGAVSLFSFKNWPALGRINKIFGQHIEVEDPTNSAGIATKRYAETFAYNVAASQWQSEITAAGTEYFYGPGGVKIFGLRQSVPIYSTNYSFADADPNWALSIAVTNFAANWQLQFSTNLSLDNGFSRFTNYSLATNTGIATFTIAKSATVSPDGVGFFRIVSPQAGGITAYYAVALNAGGIYPSNTWNLPEITNRLNALGAGKHYWTGSSNGLALVTLSYSNGVVRYIRADY